MKIKKFNCKPKLDKEVLVPSRKQILPIINELKPLILNRIFTVDEIVEIIGVFIGKRFKVDIVHARAPEVDLNDIDLNAYYDSGLDEAGDVSIELYIITNPNDEMITLDDKQFDVIAKRIADSIAHEMKHMKQSRARDWLEVERMDFAYAEDELLESQLYLGDPDEVDAYAYNIAEELLDCPNYRLKLEQPSTVTTKDSLNLWAYVHTFEGDFNHPVLKKLLKKVYKNLSNRVN